MPSLNDYAAQIHDTAVEKGWWPGEGRQFAEMIANIHSEVDEAWREWVHNHDVSETYYVATIRPDTWDRLREKGESLNVIKGAYDKWMTFSRYVSGDGSVYSHEPPKPTKSEVGMLVACGILEPHGIPTELADILIRVLDIFDAYGLDADDVVMEKMEYNLTRQHKHGGKRA